MTKIFFKLMLSEVLKSCKKYKKSNTFKKTGIQAFIFHLSLLGIPSGNYDFICQQQQGEGYSSIDKIH